MTILNLHCQMKMLKEWLAAGLASADAFLVIIDSHWRLASYAADVIAKLFSL